MRVWPLPPLPLWAVTRKQADLAPQSKSVEIVLTDAQTRTVNDGMSTIWKQGDQLSVFFAPAGTTTWSANNQFTVQDVSSNRATGTVTLEAEANDWYAFYPYTKQLPNPTTLNPEGSQYERSGYTTVGGKIQSQKEDDNMEHLAGKSVPVFGNVKNVPANEIPAIEMKNAASVVRFKVTNGTTKALHILSVKFTAPEDIVGTYYIDFSGTTPTFVGSGATYVFDNVTVNNASPVDLAPDSNSEFYAVIKPFTAASGSKLTVEIEAENADGTNASTATKEITLTAATEFKAGYIKTFNLTYSGGAEVDTFTLAEIAAMNVGDEVHTNEVLVVAKNARGIMLVENGNFLQAFNNAGVTGEVGDIVTVSGEVGEYSGLKQIVNPVVKVISSGNEVVLPDPKVLDGAAMDAYESTKIELIQYVGTLKVSGSYYNVEVPGATKKGSVQYPLNTEALTALKDKTVTATGFFTGITGSTTKYVNMMSTSVEEATVNVFDVTPQQVEVAATATSTQITVSGNVEWTAEASEGATINKVSGTGSDVITVSFAANTTPEPKEYTVFVRSTAAGVNDEFEVNITQAAASTEAKAYPYEETFATSQGDFTINNVNLGEGLTYVWKHDSSNKYMKASAYAGSNKPSESWLISPLVDMTDAVSPVLSFSHVINKYFGTVSSEATVWIKEEGGNWNQLTITYPDFPEGKNFSNWGDVSLDVASYAGKKVQVGFKYISTSDHAGTWEIKNFNLKEAVTGPVDPELTVSPSITVDEGKTATISVTTNSDGEKTWSTSDATVATVSNGVVTGVKPGSATITLSIAATANFNTKSATIPVTVNEVQTGSHYGKVNTITSGKKYLIAGGNQPRVLVPPTGTSNVKPESAAVTINAGKIESNETTNAYAVTINKNGDDVSIVLPSGKFLVYAGSSTNLKGSDTETDTWTVSEGEYGVFRLIAKSTATLATVRGLVYRAGDSKIFGGYSIANVSGEEYFDIDLYELGAEPTVVSEVKLSSIAVSGQKIDFTVGDTFTFGGVVTATYSDGSTKDVTDDADITAPDLSTAGTKTVTVSYTENEVTKTTAYQVTVSSGSSSSDKVIIIDGSQLSSDATTADTDKVYDDVTVTFSKGAKFQNCPSTATNEFAEKAILIGKKNAYVYNKTAIPGKIVKFEVYANKNASTAVTVGINFSDAAISSFNAEATNTFTTTLSSDDSVYDCTDKLSANAKYFWFQVTNDKNAQVQFRITYE